MLFQHLEIHQNISDEIQAASEDELTAGSPQIHLWL